MALLVKSKLLSFLHVTKKSIASICFKRLLQVYDEKKINYLVQEQAIRQIIIIVFFCLTHVNSVYAIHAVHSMA